MVAATPQWPQWLGRAELRAWEGLALSIDLDPGLLGVQHFLVMQQVRTDSPSYWLADNDPPWLHELCRRLQELLTALESRESKLASVDGNPGYNSIIGLEDFLTWCRSTDWRLPVEVRQYGNKPSTPAGVSAQSGSGQKKPQAQPAAGDPSRLESTYASIIRALTQLTGLDTEDLPGSTEQVNAAAKACRLKLGPKTTQTVLKKSFLADSDDADSAALGEQARKSRCAIICALFKLLDLKPGSEDAVTRLREHPEIRTADLPETVLREVLDACQALMPKPAARKSSQKPAGRGRKK